MQRDDRLAGVDVLRGLAAMLVVLHHVDIRFRINGYGVEPFLPEGLRHVLLGTGQYAVTCFFVISGFLITRLSLRRWGVPGRVSVAGFYGLRAARILPLLLLVVGLSALLHILEVSPFVIRPDRGSVGRAVVAALGFHVNWYEGRYGYLPGNWDVMWSLSVEETFYLLFPLICLTLRRPLALLLVLVPLLVIAPFNRVWLEGAQPWDNYSYLSCMDGIALGCIAGYLSERRPLGRLGGRVALALGIGAVLLVVALRKTTAALGLVSTGTDFTVLEIGMALWLLAMGSGVGNAGFARGTGTLRMIGRASYEIYLTHMFVVFGFFLAFGALFRKEVPVQPIYPISYAVVLVASVLLGYAVSRWFSDPVNRALRARLSIRRPLDALSAVKVSSAAGGSAVVVAAGVVLAMLFAVTPARAQDVVDAASRAQTLCTVVADVGTGRSIRESGDACDVRVTPASTFKIALSLMGYDSGYLVDEHLPALPFREGYPDWIESWKATTDPSAWIRNSVVWYSQRLTEWLGEERFRRYMSAFQYGNADVTGNPGEQDGLTQAWLTSSLSISPREQVEFLRKVVRRKLPVSRRAYEMTGRITLVERSPGGWEVHGKTGTGSRVNADGSVDRSRQVGWFAGWATKGNRALVFVRCGEDEARPPPNQAGVLIRDAFMKELADILSEANRKR